MAGQRGLFCPRRKGVGVFPNEDALTRLAGRILLEQNEEGAALALSLYDTGSFVQPGSHGWPANLRQVLKHVLMANGM